MPCNVLNVNQSEHVVPPLHLTHFRPCLPSLITTNCPSPTNPPDPRSAEPAFSSITRFWSSWRWIGWNWFIDSPIVLGHPIYCMGFTSLLTRSAITFCCSVSVSVLQTATASHWGWIRAALRSLVQALHGVAYLGWPRDDLFSCMSASCTACRAPWWHDIDLMYLCLSISLSSCLMGHLTWYSELPFPGNDSSLLPGSPWSIPPGIC